MLIPGVRVEFWKKKDSVIRVTTNPRADLRNPVLRSRDVRSPNPTMLMMYVIGVPWIPSAKTKPSGSDTTVVRAGAKKLVVAGMLWW